MVKWFTPSRRFALFWLTLVVGAVLGNYWEIDKSTLAWLAAFWLVIALSGQISSIEIFSLCLASVLLGIWLWQITGGESWIRLDWLSNASQLVIGWRNRLIDRIFLALPEPHGSLLAGILLGNRLKLDQSLLETFRVVGLSHIIAASGQNLTILTANVRTILQGLLGRRAFFATILVVVFYIIITGAPASILRAGLMISLVLLGRYLGRPSRSLNGLILAAGILTLFQPKIVFDIGFQLSLAATYGLVRLAPLAESLISPRWPEWLRKVIAETLSATLMTTPLIVLYFERLSLISPLINLIVVPIIPLLMALGLLASLLIMIWPFLGQLAVWLTWPILAGIVALSERAASLPLASTDLRLPSLVIGAFMTGLLAVAEYLTWRSWLASRRIEQ